MHEPSHNKRSSPFEANAFFVHAEVLILDVARLFDSRSKVINGVRKSEWPQILNKVPADPLSPEGAGCFLPGQGLRLRAAGSDASAIRETHRDRYRACELTITPATASFRALAAAGADINQRVK